MTALHPILSCATPERWLVRALGDPDTLLLDLAHCEKKAAGTALSFLFRTPDHAIAGPLSRMAREELTHFEWCLRELERRGRWMERLEPARYAGELSRCCRKRGEESLLDAFLVAALIEARSGERLVLLRDSVEDPHLKRLFSELFPPEERHVELLLGLAEQYGPCRPRVEELAAIEAALVLDGEEKVRMHS